MSAAPEGGGRRALVIGSGFGGLAAALRLSVRGWRVMVLERLPTPGGRARVHEQDGFRFDAGPTIITVPHLFEELWQLCGRRLADDVSVVPLDPYYRIRFDDGRHFDYSGDIERQVSLPAVLSHIVELLRGEAQERGVEVTVDVSSTIVDASELDTFTCAINCREKNHASVEKPRSNTKISRENLCLRFTATWTPDRVCSEVGIRKV